MSGHRGIINTRFSGRYTQEMEGKGNSGWSGGGNEQDGNMARGGEFNHHGIQYLSHGNYTPSVQHQQNPQAMGPLLMNQNSWANGPHGMSNANQGNEGYGGQYVMDQGMIPQAPGQYQTMPPPPTGPTIPSTHAKLRASNKSA